MVEYPIELSGLRKSYGKVVALQGVDLQVPAGQITGFLGPNGAGKTTTIRCLLDLIRPDAGVVRVLGYDPAIHSKDIRQQVGYLPGELNFDSNMTVSSILKYFNGLRGNQASAAFIRTLAERLGLDMHISIKNLSKGNKQKVGIVQAFMHQPHLLLLDEPTSGLDPLMQQEVYSMIREAKAKGVTVFFSSHVISEVETIADRAVIIRDGRIVEETEPGRFIEMTVRTIRVRFRNPPPDTILSGLQGISIQRKDDDREITFKVEGDIDQFVKMIAQFQIVDIESEHLSLEEAFLTYYRRKDQGVMSKGVNVHDK
jgi:ABC-2 type transport system ATP-binding protein